MAKRKRLSPAAQTPSAPAAPAEVHVGEGRAPETKAMNGWVGVRSRAPIAAVSGDAAMQSAFEEVRAELTSARSEGRMVLRLPLEAVEERYLVRDRLAQDSAEMTSLMDSLRDRGQQTPIEVVELAAGRYGLISGWRRMQALRALQEQTPKETPGGDFGFVQALVRTPADAGEAYRAMVEENEIRADLSYYERAHIAVKAAEEGIYSDPKEAIQSLFAAARAPRRSKIVAFTTLVTALGSALRWPEAISEKLGLAVVAALKADPQKAAAFQEALKGAEDASAERAALEAVLRARPAPSAGPETSGEVVPGVQLKAGRGRVTLQGEAVDARLVAALKEWLRMRGTSS